MFERIYDLVMQALSQTLQLGFTKKTSSIIMSAVAICIAIFVAKYSCNHFACDHTTKLASETKPWYLDLSYELRFID